MLLIIMIGFFYTPHNPNTMNGSLRLAPPSLSHFFGTDHFGRDVFSRVLVGAGNTLLVAAGAIVLGGVIGGMIGAIAGYTKGWFDEVVMRVVDVIATFPSVLLVLVVISVLGSGRYNILIGLGFVFIPSFARVVRSEFIRLREMDYVKSAVLIGVKPWRILVLHIMPNMLPTLLSSVAIAFNNAALAEAGMSYLGIGISPPEASLGHMMSEAQGYIASGPWCAIFPGVFLIVLVVGISLLGDGAAERFGGGTG